MLRLLQTIMQRLQALTHKKAAPLLVGVGLIICVVMSITGNTKHYTILKDMSVTATSETDNEISNENGREILSLQSVKSAHLKSRSAKAIETSHKFDDSTETYKGSFAYQSLYKIIRFETRQGRPTYALQLLNRDPMAKKLKDTEFDRLRTLIAQSFLMEGRLNRALDLASASAYRSGDEVAHAGWVGGLAAWRLGQYERAQTLFTKAAIASGNSPWMVSAGAYWASRAALRARNFSDVDVLLEIAATHQRTFYGLIAARALGRDFDFEFDLPSLSYKQIAKIESSPPALEAIRVAKSGKVTEAIALLSSSGWLSSRDKREQILVYAMDEKAPALALHLARSTKDKHGNFMDAALYPETPWRPSQGFKVDRALINALVRQESRFNPNATSPAGASGLMQLMPNTAAYMDGDIDSLKNPQTNLTIGQNYVRHLLENDLVDNDLFKFAIAYNAGPGNLAKWQKELKSIKDDPLLFIESIPMAETRAFVERVMVNYWIYTIQNERDVPSLDAIASGHSDQYQTAGQMHEVLAFNLNP